MPECLCPGRQPRVSLMIWACLTWNGVGTICVVNGNINAHKYIDILNYELWPVVARHFPNNNFILQDANAPVHRTRITTEFKQSGDINSMTWPAQSPDCNIIENCWLLLKNKFKQRTLYINNVTALEREIRHIWTNIPVMHIQNLYISIPRRLITVIRAKGHITKY